MLTTEELAALTTLLEQATPAPWGVYVQPVESRRDAAAELCMLVMITPTFTGELPMLTTPNGPCPAVTGVGTDGGPNALLIAALRNAAPALLEMARRANELESAETSYKANADGWLRRFGEAARERDALKARVSDLTFAMGDGAGWFDRYLAVRTERDDARNARANANLAWQRRYDELSNHADVLRAERDAARASHAKLLEMFSSAGDT